MFYLFYIIRDFVPFYPNRPSVSKQRRNPMDKTNFKKLLPCLWSTGSILLLSGALFLMHRQSPYYLLYLTAVFLLLLGGLNLSFLFFRIEGKPAPAAAPEEHQEEPAEISPQAARKKRIRLHLPAFAGTLFRQLLGWTFRFLRALLPLAILAGGAVWFAFALKAPLPAETPAYWQLAVLVVFFVLTILLDKLCKHSAAEDRFTAMLLRNARAFFTLARVALVLLALSLTLQLLNLYDLRAKAVTALAILFYYTVVMLLFSLAGRIVRREMTTAPGMVILLPFTGADLQELAIIPFLEQNTGITLRNLWSIRYLSNILPYTLAGAAALFWLATGIVYVQSHQEAAVYRLGVLQAEPLSPGLHFVLPYPLDRAELYDTSRVSTVTIGYISSEHADNVWTASNGEEYKLLLGSGDELVSINLRVEYRISDLNRYLSASAAPEQILEASAYKLVADRTMGTDLETLLSVDRETFTQAFLADLSAELDALDTGLELVGIIMESIHPPIEVAPTYQQFLGAEIDAEKIILNAQAEAAVKIAEAETFYQETINAAKSDYWAKLAAAKTEVAEFVAAVETAENYADEYTYYKYLEALGSAYQGSKLVIVGSGVDRSRLYFGSFGSAANAAAASE